MSEAGVRSHPVLETERIESLDVLRGFALLGILLLNILGFGLIYANYNNAGLDLIGGRSLDIAVWASVELFAEGAMRCLFSMLFGAGIVLFTTGARGKGGLLHYKRTFWLLAFGLFDAYILLWGGDILYNYAVAGALLYWLRNFRGGWLLAWGGLLILLLSLLYAGMNFGLSQSYEAAQVVAAAENPEAVDPRLRAAAQGWEGFAGDFQPTPEEIEAELAERRGSYQSAFGWNAKKVNETIVVIFPMLLIWDTLAMMLLGMAFFKFGILQGDRPRRFYWTLVVLGFGIGLPVNAYEVYGAWSSGFDLFKTFPQMQPTYQIGRLGLGCGYIGLIVLFSQSSLWQGLKTRLAAVGRMALTNYLMHSVICLFLFTGAGLGLIGEISRAGLYPIVFGIWLVQLVLSPWWLKYFQFGPVEWLWRWLTYGVRPKLLRRS